MSVLDAIGNTPLVEIINLWDSEKTGVRIMAKLEGSNPGGSVKPIFRTFSQGGGGIFRFTFQGMTAKLPRMPVYRNKSVCQHFS